MSWYNKEQPTHLDATEIEGLCYLDGDLLARLYGRDWTKGQKFPLIAFPSGIERDLWESSNPDKVAIVHLFGEMDLPLKDTCDSGYNRAMYIAEQVGYNVEKSGDTQLILHGFDRDEHYLISYDNERGYMVDVALLTNQPDVPYRMPLLTEEIRAKLPKLYSNEHLGLEAQAQVKFFTPSSNWTWYASEFDGEDVFFGLVIGFEIELGYFTLSELEEIGGGLTLPIERDKFFEPKTLRELQAQHRREREE
jgi:hypothetical protein